MADSGQQTEKPTKQRIDKARKEGNFPSSKEFLSSVQFLGFVTVAVSFTGAFVVRLTHVMRALFVRAFSAKSAELTTTEVVSLVRDMILPVFEPLVLVGAAVVLLVLFAQMAASNMGVSFSKLAPDFKRLNFLKKITNLPSQNLPPLLQAMVLLPIVGFVVYYEATENLDSFLELPWLGAQAAVIRVAGTFSTLLWRAAALFLVVGFIDLIWQRHRYTKQLKMSKQEVRDESKEQEGNPQLKMRVRRMQRDAMRRQMMKEVPTATAIIVNPTHYAVAIRYSVDAPGAPKVVAKGKNYVAARIRKIAMEHQIPVVENPPLARALHESVEMGQEIPAHLYRAVAEILAYIYRLMNGKLPGA
jgi:flagellar biosynthesis protein FlhB